MTTDDGLEMVSVGNALMSPDGQWVLYSRSELNWDDNKRETTYHMIPAGGEESFQFTGKAGDSGVDPCGQHHHSHIAHARHQRPHRYGAAEHDVFHRHP